MTIKTFDDHVLPRPVEELPEYAKAPARNKLRDTLTASFGLSPEAATAVANAVVDPTEVRKKIGDPNDPQAEQIPVPGGTLLAVRSHVWSRRIMPDPRNPRIGPARRHPFAVDPGTGGEDSRFRPVPEPTTPEGFAATAPELAVRIESRQHLEWASVQAAKYVLAENDWRPSIQSQGVMEAVWLVATTYTAEDGTAPATVVTTVEGSSRTTAVHNLAEIRSADVPYAADDAKIRARHKNLNAKFTGGTATAQDLIVMRVERIPALVVVGFRPHPSANTEFPTAVRSMVAVRHVDPPKPWGEGPENEALADEVLDELYRRGLIPESERAWLAGSCTKAEARAAHLSGDPVVRAAHIVSLLTSDEPDINYAIRVAVTSQSTRKRIFPKLRNELATALILRAVPEDSSRVDQYRRYMRHGFGKAVHRESWEATDIDTARLAGDALDEVTAYIGDENATEPGPASLELAVRAAVPLITTGRLNADRGTAGNDQPDRRTPGEVLDAMRRTHHGIYQLRQALDDFAADQPIRAVEPDGKVRLYPDGSAEMVVNDILLREEWPINGIKRPRSGGKTPDEKLNVSLIAFKQAMDAMLTTHKAVGEVTGDDGLSLIETIGADPHLCKDLRESLDGVNDDLLFWGRTFSRRYGTTSKTADADLAGELDTDPGGTDETDDAYDASYEDWSDPAAEGAA
jgi:hypothetical protein